MNEQAQELKRGVLHALTSAHAEEEHDDPKLSSARFVWKLGEKLKSAFCPDDNFFLQVQKVLDGPGVPSEKNGKPIRKLPGEWLLDIAIVQRTKIQDSGSGKKSVADINTRIIWAVESESHTGLSQFAEDFGKLLCVSADNYLYLNGLDQEPGNQSAYIKRRIETIERDLSQSLRDLADQQANFYLGFWPSPSSGKWGREADLDELLREVRLYVLEANDLDVLKFRKID